MKQRYSVFNGKYENEKKKGTKKIDLPQWGFEPGIFEQIPAQNLNFEGYEKKSPLPSRKNTTL